MGLEEVGQRAAGEQIDDRVRAGRGGRRRGRDIDDRLCESAISAEYKCDDEYESDGSSDVKTCAHEVSTLGWGMRKKKRRTVVSADTASTRERELFGVLS